MAISAIWKAMLRPWLMTFVLHFGILLELFGFELAQHPRERGINPLEQASRCDVVRRDRQIDARPRWRIEEHRKSREQLTVGAESLDDEICASGLG
jgi:hypothetical protein